MHYPRMLEEIAHYLRSADNAIERVRWCYDVYRHRPVGMTEEAALAQLCEAIEALHLGRER